MAENLPKSVLIHEAIATLSTSTTAALALKEDTANKKTSLAEDSETYIPTQNAVNDGLALKEDVANKKTTLSDNSDTYYPTQKAVKTANDLKVNADGTTSIQFTTGSQKIGNVSGGNYVEIEPDGTLEFIGDGTHWDDMRVVPGSFDRPGASDPAIIALQPGGSGTKTYLWEFAKNNIASFTVQLPHSYKVGSDIKAHIHWTPGNRGNEENGATVGWKIDYSWASINGNFGAMATLDLQDACDGVDWKHQMTPDINITGTDKGISSMLICNIKRTDTGTDDTWAGTASGSLPLLLEIDFHYEIDTVGSRDTASK